jgi:8-oxo-dGTP pyrophosphatase MutT (NUDIX family)
MPVAIEEDGKSPCGYRIKGYLSKDKIHKADNPLLHPTTLILVVKKNASGEYSIILANKAPKVLRLEEEVETQEIFYDCLGGHLEEEDCLGVLDNDVFQKGAKRELSEELLIPAASEGNELILFTQIKYGPAKMPKDAGVNFELSNIYLYKLPDSVKDIHSDMIMRDDYNIPETGKHVVRNFFVTEFTLDELLNKYSEHHELFMDGVGRIIDYWAKSNFSSQELTKWLEP